MTWRGAPCTHTQHDKQKDTIFLYVGVGAYHLGLFPIRRTQCPRVHLLNPWGSGDVKTWGRGDVETWRQGNVETWRRGDVRTRTRYDTDTIRYGVRRYNATQWFVRRCGYDTIKDTIRYNTIRYDTMQHDTLRCDTMVRETMAKTNTIR